MPKKAADQLPETGSLYGFATDHFFDWKSGETGRFAAFKFIGVHRGDTPVTAVLDGVFEQMPALDEVIDLPVLRCNRGSFRNDPAVHGIAHYSSEQLSPYRLLGTAPISEEETKLAEKCRRFSLLNHVELNAELEWRAIHEADDFTADMARYIAEQDAKRAAQQAHYETRLKGLTFDTLLSETLFENWKPSPPYPPSAFIEETRTELRGVMETLHAMGDKPKKAAVRKAMKAAVEWLNAADERFGGVIETEEREDLCEVLIEIAHAARQPSLGEEIDQWRDW